MTIGPIMQRHTICKTEFKAHALEIFRKIEATGEPLIVTGHGRPTLEIRPYRPPSVDARKELVGSVVRYDDPLEPVGEDDCDLGR